MKTVLGAVCPGAGVNFPVLLLAVCSEPSLWWRREVVALSHPGHPPSPFALPSPVHGRQRTWRQQTIVRDAQEWDLHLETQLEFCLLGLKSARS